MKEKNSVPNHGAMSSIHGRIYVRISFSKMKQFWQQQDMVLRVCQVLPYCISIQSLPVSGVPSRSSDNTFFQQEQMLRERQVSGRIQLQVWLHDDDLVVSVLAADDLACRSEDSGHGTIPEAYAKLRLLPVM